MYNHVTTMTATIELIVVSELPIQRLQNCVSTWNVLVQLQLLVYYYDIKTYIYIRTEKTFVEM